MDSEQEIKNIKERNERVENNKAWETSWTRRIAIATFTYIAALTWLIVIENTEPWLNAFIPAGAYILSTLSLFFIKNRWTHSRNL